MCCADGTDVASCAITTQNSATRTLSDASVPSERLPKHMLAQSADSLDSGLVIESTYMAMIETPTVKSPSSGRANLILTSPTASVDVSAPFEDKEQPNFVSQALSLAISPPCAASESTPSAVKNIVHGRESKTPSVDPRPTSMAKRDRGVRMEQEMSNCNTSHALSNINCSLSVAHLKQKKKN